MAIIGNISTINVNGNELTIKDAALTEIVNEIIDAIGANNTNIAERINDLHNRSFDNTIKISSQNESEIASIQDGLYKIQYVTVTGEGDNATETLNNSAILIQKGTNQYLYKDGQLSSRTKTNNTWGNWITFEGGVTSVNGMTGAVSLSIPDDSNLVHKTGNETISGTKMFKSVADSEVYIDSNIVKNFGGAPNNNWDWINVTGKGGINETLQQALDTRNNLVTSVNGMTGAVTVDIPVTSVNGATGAVVTSLSSNYATATGTNSDLLLVSGDTYEQAFGKLEKEILDNELITAAGMNDLNDQIANIIHPVSSVNGMTGAVVLNIPVTSVNGMTGAVTITETQLSKGTATGTGNAVTDINVSNHQITLVKGATYATQSDIDTSIANLVDSAPETLNTLNELAAALGNDENFATTVATQIGEKYTKPSMGIPASDLAAGVIPDVPVQSVNGMTGAVIITHPVTSVNGMTGAITISQVQADWNATSGDAQILNKPDINTNYNPNNTYIGQNTYVHITNPKLNSYIDVGDNSVFIKAGKTTTNQTDAFVTFESANSYNNYSISTQKATHVPGTYISHDINNYIYNNEDNSYINSTVTFFSEYGFSYGMNSYIDYSFSEASPRGNKKLTNYKFNSSYFTITNAILKIDSYSANDSSAKGNIVLQPWANGGSYWLAVNGEQVPRMDDIKVTSVNGMTGAVTITHPVTSVNGQTGAVTLTIPDAVTESTVAGWGFTKNTGTLTTETQLSKGTATGNGNAVTDINVSNHQITLVKGKTFLETAPVTSVNGKLGAVTVKENVQSDWNATTGDAVILNKPTIPAAVTESTVAGWGFTKNTGTLTTETQLSKGTATGTGNAVTDINVSNHQITLVKGATYATQEDINESISNLVNSAPATLDTLNELATALGNDPNFATTVATQIGEKYTKPSTGIPASDLAAGVIPDVPVQSVNGMTGAVNINVGVTSFNGSTGAVTYTAPVTSVNGQTGAVTVKANVQSDWNATTGDAVILNKPTIPTVNDSTVTITMNGNTVGTFTLNKSGNTTIDLGTVLTSHQSIKTVNNESLVGTGNVTIQGLPTVTSADNGKVLMVVNGEWQLVSPVSLYSGSSAPSNSQGNNGDIYVQS